MGQVLLLERTVLEIAHDRVKLGHGVADRSAGGEDNATTAGDLVHIAAFHKHIRRFLGFGGGETCHVPHFCVEEQVFERMALVHEQPVNTQLFKCDDIILSVGGKKFIQSGFQRFSGFLHLLDGKILATLIFQFCDCTLNLINLFLQLPFLSLGRQRNLLKLAVTDDNGIIVAGCNTSAELLSVCGFKIFLRGNKELGTRIEVEELICPLQGEVVRNHKHGLLAQPKSFALHSGCCHFKGFARTNFVCEQGISTVKHMGDGISLMFTEGNVRVHTAEADMAAIILTGSGGVEKLIVLRNQCFTTAGVFPYPILKRILDCLLFLLCQSGFLFIQDTLLLAICIFDGVIDTNVFQVQRFFQNAISIGTVSTVGHIRRHIIVAGRAFPIDTPLCGHFGEFHLNGTAQVVWGLKGFLHELLNIVCINPCGTQTDINLRRIQILRLCLLQCLHIDIESGITVRRHLCDTQLASHITRKVFVRSLPTGFHIIRCHRVFEDHPTQLCLNGFIVLRGSQELCHERKINFTTLTNRDCQSFRWGIHAGHSAFLLDRSLGEHIRLAL